MAYRASNRNRAASLAPRPATCYAFGNARRVIRPSWLGGRYGYGGMEQSTMSESKDLGRVRLGKGELTGYVWHTDGPTVAVDYPGAYFEFAGVDNLRAMARIFWRAAAEQPIDGGIQPVIDEIEAARAALDARTGRATAGAMCSDLNHATPSDLAGLAAREAGGGS